MSESQLTSLDPNKIIRDHTNNTSSHVVDTSDPLGGLGGTPFVTPHLLNAIVKKLK